VILTRTGGGDKSFTFVQSTPAAVVTIAHNLGKHPSVTIVDTAGTVFIPDVEYLDLNSVRVTNGAPFSFTAYLN
jgi:hypothetical protein